MGCSSLGSAESLQQRHEEQAARALRPDYLKPANDPHGLSEEQFQMATRVFLHFDEDGSGKIDMEEMRRIRDEMLKRKLKSYCDLTTDEELASAMNDPEWEATIKMCEQSFDKARKKREEFLDRDHDGYLAYENDLKKKNGKRVVNLDLMTLEKIWCTIKGIDPHISNTLQKGVHKIS